MRKHFFYLCIFSFILIAQATLMISVFALGKHKSAKYREKTVMVKSYNKSVPIPKLKGEDPFPEISAFSVLVTDVESRFVLYEKNSSIRLLPASTTKIVTALVALDYYSLDSILTVPELNVEGQKMNLIPGEQISVRNLIYGLLVYSANDAAEVLASSYPGGKQSFVKAMNLKVEEMGLENTFFENPSGFDGEMQYTTAFDLTKITDYAMKNNFFRDVVGTKEIIVGSYNAEIAHRLKNINKLIGEVEGVLGVKTGWTENAKENLVTFLDRNGRKIIVVVLNSQDRFGDTKKIIDWVFKNYSWDED